MDEKVTREQLEKLVYEELTKEGYLSRVMAYAKGNTSALKALGQRPIQALQLLATGKADLSKIQDPQLVKAVTMAVHRVAGYEGKFAKLLQDFTQDLELMFGGDLSKAPQIKPMLDKLDQSSTLFAKELGDISKQIEGVLQHQQEPDQAAPASTTPPTPEPPSPLSPTPAPSAQKQGSFPGLAQQGVSNLSNVPSEPGRDLSGPSQPKKKKKTAEELMTGAIYEQVQRFKRR